MSGLHKQLKVLAASDDCHSVIDELTAIMSDQTFKERFETSSKADQKAICSLLQTIQEKIEGYRDKMIIEAQTSHNKIDAAKEMSKACVAYTKGKQTE